MDDDGFESAIRQIFAEIRQRNDEECELYLALHVSDPLVADGIRRLKARDPEGYSKTIPTHSGKLIDGAVRAFGIDPGHAFLFSHYDMISRHVRFVITSVEGHCCCADKTRTVMNMMKRALIDGADVIYDRTAEYTFNFPDKVFLSKVEIIEFYFALKWMFWGTPLRFCELSERYQAMVGG